MFKEARWDRNLPADINSANERIKVSALFSGGKITPRYFIWRNKLYRVRKVNFFWQAHKGKDKVSLFSVNTGTDNYQISFYADIFTWRLDKIFT